MRLSNTELSKENEMDGILPILQKCPFTAYIGQSDDFKIEKMWITLDARPKRRDEKWLNVILRKQDIS